VIEMKLKHRSLLVFSALVIATGALAYGKLRLLSRAVGFARCLQERNDDLGSTSFGYANKLFAFLPSSTSRGR